MPERSLLDRIEQLESDNARLRGLLDREGMPDELRHQIRNTLAMVRAVVRRSADHSRTVEDYAAHLEGRIDAILRVQSTTTRSPREGVDMHSIVADELLAHVAHEGEQVLITGPGLRLRPRAAELLALTFHELTTNAVKFGALTRPEGRIAVTWQVDRLDQAGVSGLAIVWRESGMRGLGRDPSREGFGTQVLERMLRYELKAETSLDFQPSGLDCRIRLPFSPQVGTVVPGAKQTAEDLGEDAVA